MNQNDLRPYHELAHDAFQTAALYLDTNLSFAENGIPPKLKGDSTGLGGHLLYITASIERVVHQAAPAQCDTQLIADLHNRLAHHREALKFLGVEHTNEGGGPVYFPDARRLLVGGGNFSSVGGSYYGPGEDARVYKSQPSTPYKGASYFAGLEDSTILGGNFMAVSGDFVEGRTNIPYACCSTQWNGMDNRRQFSSFHENAGFSPDMSAMTGGFKGEYRSSRGSDPTLNCIIRIPYVDEFLRTRQ
ncbi:hypothetical protein CVT26_008853 [Gymnopilus dilepis]|uniref:Uncharacterized protein n=1 Tax=Gymnopilus dilepis TaxID=231916 RepID=A0A409WUF8_9AGAR|nr:hypothetical protein CVT26_008853 [Gymnopilus dilepis]